VNTGLYRTGNNEADITTALSRLFNKQEYLGNLYNPVFRSNWKIISVNFKDYEGLADISLDGAYVRSGDTCDDSRVRAQIWSTIRQFPGVKTVYILLNGNLLGDILATGK
jgi:spore germination protein GerM